MPGYKAHLTGGALLGVVGLAAAVFYDVYTPDPERALVLMVIVLLGALFPDTDTDSKGQNLFYGCLVLLDIALMLKGQYRWAAVLGFCAMLPAVGRHRGWTHTWWAMILVPVPIVALPVFFYDRPPTALLPFYLAAVLGYFSHLALDRKL